MYSNQLWIVDTKGNDLESMIEWIKDASSVQPQENKNILLLVKLTGFQPDEAQNSLWLIKTSKKEFYLDQERR